MYTGKVSKSTSGSLRIEWKICSPRDARHAATPKHLGHSQLTLNPSLSCTSINMQFAGKAAPGVARYQSTREVVCCSATAVNRRRGAEPKRPSQQAFRVSVFRFRTKGVVFFSAWKLTTCFSKSDKTKNTPLLFFCSDESEPNFVFFLVISFYCYSSTFQTGPYNVEKYQPQQFGRSRQSSTPGRSFLPCVNPPHFVRQSLV